MKRHLPPVVIGGLVILILVAIFGRWFTFPQIIGGDWPYFYPENLQESSLYPAIWVNWLGNGTGGISPLLGLREFQEFLIVVFHQWLGFPWDLVYKVGWYGLVLCLSFYSSQFLFKTVVKTKTFGIEFLASLIWTSNTYILMILGGGQMGVALAYALSPLVLACFIRLIDHFMAIGVQLKYSVTAGLILSVQILLDPRIAYVTLVAVGVYYLATLIQDQMVKGIQITKILMSVISVLVIPLSLSVSLNAFWLFPLIMLRENPITQAGSAYYANIFSVKFFSFADFSHALSLLQPNWPENIFGKTYFLQPEFLIIPILAFTALWWKTERGAKILIFSLLGLLGAFLAKGIKEPFGLIYGLLFLKIPGFEMFRDPTKWYVLPALSYSVLVPYTLLKIQKSKSFKLLFLMAAGFMVLWSYLIRPALSGDLGGTFRLHLIPQEYVEARKVFIDQPDFYRTLWVPKEERFSWVTLSHPGLEASILFEATNAAQLKSKLLLPGVAEELAAWSVKYVVVPYDALGEFFLTDRKYDDKIRQAYIEALDQISWLKKMKDGKITIYKTADYHSLFWLDSGKISNVEQLEPNVYQVSLESNEPTTLNFSQAYHSGWVAQMSSHKIRALKGPYGMNSFHIDDPGRHNLLVYFEPQKYVWYGTVISTLSLLCSIVVLLIIRR